MRSLVDFIPPTDVGVLDNGNLRRLRIAYMSSDYVEHTTGMCMYVCMYMRLDDVEHTTGMCMYICMYVYVCVYEIGLCRAHYRYVYVCMYVCVYVRLDYVEHTIGMCMYVCIYMSI